MESEIKQTYIIKSVQKAVQLLQEMGSLDKGDIGVNELSRRLGFNKNQTFRLLKTLESGGFVKQDKNNDRYRLGLGVFSLAGKAYQNIGLVQAAGPAIDRLAEYTDESVHLAAYHNLKAVIVDRRKSLQHISLTARLGGQYPLHAGACPQAILAYLPFKLQEKIIKQMDDLPQYTEKTLKHKSDLRRKIKEIKELGYVISDQDVDKDARAVGAAILDRDGFPVAAVSIAGPVTRLSLEMLNEYAEKVVETVEEIALRMGFK